MNYTIPIAKPYLQGNEINYTKQCIETGWISSKGNFVDQFEKQFSAFCDCKEGIAVGNGTVALHLALAALHVQDNDEIIVPDLTFAATANAVLYCRAKPVLVDVDKKTWNIDHQKIEAAITKKTKAIIAVHLYGYPCEMENIMEIARRHKIYVIEDCAEAHGALLRGKKAGSWGDIGCFSFYGNKIITTGEGGMCVTNNASLAEKMRELRDHGMRKDKPRYWHEEIGFNYRLTNIQAALGVAQLENMEKFIEKRNQIGSWYTKKLKHISSAQLQPIVQQVKNVVWLYPLVLTPTFKKSRDDLVKLLEENGIETRNFFYPLHTMPPYKTKGDFSVSENLSKQGVCLPCYYEITEKDVDTIVKIIKEASL